MYTQKFNLRCNVKINAFDHAAARVEHHHAILVRIEASRRQAVYRSRSVVERFAAEKPKRRIHKRSPNHLAGLRSSATS